MIQFADSDTTDEAAVFAGDAKAAKLAGKSAVFVIVQKAEVIEALDGTKPEKKSSKKSILPIKNFEADCLFTAYGVSSGSFVVTDWHGNEIKTFKSKPSIASVKSAVSSAKTKAAKAEKAMAKDSEAATKAFDKGDHAKALKAALKVFKHGMAGFAAVESTQLIYESILEEGRLKLSTAKDAGDAKTLASLKKTFKGTDLEGEVKLAEKAIKAKK